MRARLLVVLLAVAGTFAVFGAALAMWGGGPPNKAGMLSVDVKDLGPGGVLPMHVTLPRSAKGIGLLFVVHPPGDRVQALLGRSTHLGCRVNWVGEPNYQRFEESTRATFEDPCGGSVFALNGACVGGPCPRGLDGYHVRVTRGIAEIDVRHLVRGLPRGAA